MNAKPFPVAAVLSVLTGRPVAPATAADAIHLTEWITGTPLMIRDFIFCCDTARASRAARGHLAGLFPDLGGVTAPDFADGGAVAGWLAVQAGRFGGVLEVARMVPVPRRRDPRDTDFPKAAVAA